MSVIDKEELTRENEWEEAIFNNHISLLNEKVSSEFVTKDNYVSTDNMIPNRGGVEKAKSFPKQTKFNSFKEGDVLFSNIRTYFKKVWKADFSGGCSNDVLIFRSLDENILSQDFLYYLISNENFIQHTVYTAKGTKMPRGDKDAINKYQFKLPPLPQQKQIATILSTLDQKIALLKKQNQTLEELAQTLFKRWFVDFEFPCLPSNYRPHGQVNPKDMAAVCSYKRVGGLPVPEDPSWFIYILLCEDGSFYKGMTNDLYRRFFEHYNGEGAKHTKIHKPIKVIHWEQFESQSEARNREEELKSGFGRTWLQREYDKFLKYGYPKEGGLPAHQTRLMMAGKMIASELGEIPEGWSVGTLSEIVDVINGYSYKGVELQESDVAMVTLKNFDRNGGFRFDGFKELKSNRYKEKHTAKENDLVVAHTDLTQDAEVLGNPALIQPHSKYKEFVISMDLVKVVSKKDDINTPFLYYLMKDRKFKSHCIGYSNGTTVLHLNKLAIPEFEIALPLKSDLVIAFGKYAKETREKITINTQQVQSLTQLRDTLLPKLMSGSLAILSACNAQADKTKK